MREKWIVPWIMGVKIDPPQKECLRVKTIVTLVSLRYVKREVIAYKSRKTGVDRPRRPSGIPLGVDPSCYIFRSGLVVAAPVEY